MPHSPRSVKQARKRCLITGGCGFIGHHVVEHFVKNADFEIIVLDKLSYASKGPSPRCLRHAAPVLVRLLSTRAHAHLSVCVPGGAWGGSQLYVRGSRRVRPFTRYWSLPPDTDTLL